MRLFIAPCERVYLRASVSVSLQEVLQLTAQGLVVLNLWNTVPNKRALSFSLSLICKGRRVPEEPQKELSGGKGGGTGGGAGEPTRDSSRVALPVMAKGLV